MTPQLSLNQLLAEGAVLNVDGDVYDIAPLTVADWSEFAAEVRNENLKTLYKSVRGAGVDPRVTSSAIARLLDSPFSEAQLIAHAGSVIGAEWVLRRSLKRAGNKQIDQVLARIPYDVRMNKAMIVLHLSGVINLKPRSETESSDPLAVSESPGVASSGDLSTTPDSA